MPRIATYQAHKPTLQFRYKMTTSKLANVQIYGRSAQQPSYENAPVSVEHGNYYFKVKGKTRWNSVTLSCYQFEGITAKELWDYLNNDHQSVAGAEDKYADSYKHDMQLMLLGPDGSSVVGTWKLMGAFIENNAWGDLDWGTDDVVQCELTIAYDYAEFS